MIDIFASDENEGWDRFDRPMGQPKDPAARALVMAYWHTFTSPPGAMVLEDLRRRTVENVMPPWSGRDNRATTEGELRSLEGQRLLVRYILNQLQRAQTEEG